jgi:methylated-DNA-protein-cysteine methyltransferase related protein
VATKEVFYHTLSAIPQGRYTSYGRIAKLCGIHVRQVQAWLRTLPRDSGLPWFRIINSQRKITEHSGSARQYELLAREGLIPDRNGKFPIEYFWPND